MKKNIEYIYGQHAVLTLVKKAPRDIVRIHVDQARMDQRMRELTESARAGNIDVDVCAKAALNDLVGEVRHQGVVAQCRLPTHKSENDLVEILETLSPPALILVLDQVQDPHNLGACLRSADACGVHCVIAPKDRSASLNATVFKVSTGAALSVPYIQVTNLARTLRLLKQYGVWIAGTSDAATDNLFDADFTQGCALVLGSESKGLRRLTLSECDTLVSVPMHGMVESLNVSVAAGVCLYEVVRQRAADRKLL